MKYLLGLATIALIWAVARNWQQVQRLKERQRQIAALDDRYQQAKANLDIAHANQQIDDAEYQRRLHMLHEEWQKRRG